MQQIVYKCDKCGVEIGARKHISLRLAVNSGIAIPPDGGGKGWETKPILQGKFLHFDKPICLAGYFADLLTPPKQEKPVAKKKKPAKKKAKKPQPVKVEESDEQEEDDELDEGEEE